MAVVAIRNGMAQLQRKKIVINTGSFPLEGIYFMTNGTILRKACLDMIRICRCHKVTPVAVNTIDSQYIKTDRVFRLVT